MYRFSRLNRCTDSRRQPICPYHSGCHLLTSVKGSICNITFYLERYFVRNKSQCPFFSPSAKHVCNQDFILCIPYIFIVNGFFISLEGEKNVQVTVQIESWRNKSFAVKVMFFEIGAETYSRKHDVNGEIAQ